MRVLLDTQAFIYAIDENQHHKLPGKARRVLLDPENARELSAASVSEIALKVARRRLGITENQLCQGLKLLNTEILPVKREHVLRLFRLPLHHSDPIDRILIAVALAEDIPIVGGDRLFARYQGLKIIW
jgi:PIN domain nuclease of toxin-antitoxin system